MNNIDKVWVISASTSFERREIIKKRLKKLEIEFEFYISGPLPFFNVLHESLKLKFPNNSHIQNPNEIAATLAHLNCIQISKQNGYNKVLILEDDTLLRNDFVSKLEECVDNLPNDWDIAYCVVNNQIPSLHQRENDFWYKTGASTLACAYIINSTYYDEILNYYENNYDVIDVCFYKKQMSGNYYSTSEILAYPNPKMISSIDPTIKIIDTGTLEKFEDISDKF